MGKSLGVGSHSHKKSTFLLTKNRLDQRLVLKFPQYTFRECQVSLEVSVVTEISIVPKWAEKRPTFCIE